MIEKYKGDKNMSEFKEIKISGTGTVPSGEYFSIKIWGDGDILGNIKSSQIKVVGTAISKGEIVSDILNVSGTFNCNENVSSEALIKVTGSANVKGKLKGNEVNIYGNLAVDKNIEVDKLKVMGEIETLKDCECTTFNLNGSAKIDGLLSADNVKMKLYGKSYIKEIGGEEIVVEINTIKKILSLGAIESGYLTSTLIEGDKINLINTKCDLVRGHNIVIGSGCNINKIEYTGTLTVDQRSEVGESECMKN